MMSRKQRKRAGRAADAFSETPHLNSNCHHFTPIPGNVPDAIRKPLQRAVRRCDQLVQAGCMVTLLVSFVDTDNESAHACFGDTRTLDFLRLALTLESMAADDQSAASGAEAVQHEA